MAAPSTAQNSPRSVNTAPKKFAPELVGLQNIQEIMDLSKNKTMTPQNAKTIVGESLYGLKAPITPINIPRQVTPLTDVTGKGKQAPKTPTLSFTPKSFGKAAKIDTPVVEDPKTASKMQTVELMQKTKVTSGSKTDFVQLPPRSVTLAVKR